MERVCYFHAGCPDGFGAAWATWRAWGEEGRYVAYGHYDPIDGRRHEGQLVCFVDIAPPNESIRELAESTARLVVLDHHVSARDRFEAEPGVENMLASLPHHIEFDLEHSGAMLAWRHFHPDTPPPDLLRYVEDQDLWNWKLPRSEEVNAAIGSYPQDFEAWSKLAARPVEELAEEGAPIVRAQRIEILRALTHAHPVAIGTDRIEATNASNQRSFIGHELAKRNAYGRPWGLVYRVNGDRVDATLYSIGDVEVVSIAERYGGGGHRNAAGFSVSLRTWLDEFVC
ncbi:MAG: hypothetical protein VX546_08220 [Myxococcota bacterium]|nr:hypothetical protein [Myxococcota bacterium]